LSTVSVELVVVVFVANVNYASSHVSFVDELN